MKVNIAVERNELDVASYLYPDERRCLMRRVPLGGVWLGNSCQLLFFRDP